MTSITPQSDNNAIKAWMGSASEDDFLEALNGPHGMEWIGWRMSFTGENLAHFAARNHYSDALKKMAVMGFDMARQDESGDNPLHYALIYSGRGNEKDTVEFLLECGLAQNHCNEEQFSSVAQMIVERRWCGDQPDPVEWLVLAQKHGMSITEEVSENMKGTPLEVMTRQALDPSRGNTPYEQCIVELLDRGALSEQHVRWALIAAREKLSETYEDAEAMLKPASLLQSWLDRADIQRATLKNQANQTRSRL